MTDRPRYQRPQPLIKAGNDLVLLGAGRRPPAVDCYVIAADNLYTLEAIAAEWEAAFNAACAFIDCHVSDPDQTPKMCDAYAEFLNHRHNLTRKTQ